MSLLSSGLSGVTILSVFSSAIPGTFIIPRTIDATAILFKEPENLFSSKESSYPKKKKRSCSKTIIPLGRTKRKIMPVLNKISRIMKPISTFKSKLYDKLGLSCVIPKLLRPYQPAIKRLQCKFGLDEIDENRGFIETGKSSCNSKQRCREPSLERKAITRSHGLLSSYHSNQINVNSYEDCFPENEKATYGSRVLAKLVNDSSCDDPRYRGICEELSDQNRIVVEDDCQSDG